LNAQKHRAFIHTREEECIGTAVFDGAQQVVGRNR
jgi:hypothetical protein